MKSVDVRCVYKLQLNLIFVCVNELRIMFFLFFLSKNGNMVCSRIRCSAPSCNNPVYHAGECCPR